MSGTAAAALLRANRRRRSIRRWIAWCSIPFLLAALLFTGKLLSMYAFAYQSIASYLSGDYTGSIRAAQALSIGNWFEPAKAPFDEGVGLAASGKLPEGQRKFEEALSLAHGLEVCDIRINLGIVLEWQGDAAAQAKDPVTAVAFYAEALKVNAETPKECRSPEAQQQSSDPQRDMSQSLDDQADRLQQKQQEQQNQQQNPDRTPQEQEQQPQPDPSKLDELQQKLQQGEQERRQQQQDSDDDGGSGGTDKPW